MRLAVLNHDTTELDTICSILNSAGHTALPCPNGKELLQQVRRDAPDLVVLDWHNTDIAPAEVLQGLREKLQLSLPILLIAPRSGEDDIVAGLAAGASDYLIKPIRRSELVARVQVLLRRTYPNQHVPENLEFGAYVFDTGAAHLTLKGHAIALTQKEFDLALLLFRNLGRPLSRTYILASVWSREADIPSRTLDTHISRVRNKLLLKPENGFRLAPVYSYGYRLEQPA